jgi:general secretion pathway protein D
MKTRSHVVTLCTVVMLMVGCASDQWTRDAAQELTSKGDFEQSIKILEEGLREHPDSVTLKAALLSARQEAVSVLLRRARDFAAQGQWLDAQQALVKAVAVGPRDARVEAASHDLVIAQKQDAALTKAKDLSERGELELAAREVGQALKANPRHGPLLELQRQVETKRRAQQLLALQTGLSEDRPVSLDFKDAGLRTVLDAISRNSGLNFVLDKDVRADARVTVFLRQARVDDALDLITSTNQLSKKVLDAKTVLIYPNTPEKQKEYLEQVVKVFQLSSADAKAAASFLKSMLKPRNELFVDERSNLLAMRDSAENIAIAEKLVAVFDTGEPEVLLDVEVLEISSTRLTELGIKPPTAFSFAPLAPQGGITLANLPEMGKANVGVTLPSLTLNLRREIGDVTTLANPKIRTRSKEKASILIGDKIPVVTTTSGQGGFVSDSVNYLDVGLKLNVEPTVYPDDEVAIKIQLEVSSLGSAVKTSSGTLAYQIGTRNATTLLRLQDGETQLLAGLLSKEERTAASRLPGLGDLPAVGRVFSSTQDNSHKTELVLAITPRVLRNVRKLDSFEAETWIGTEALQRLRTVEGVKVPSLKPTTYKAEEGVPVPKQGVSPPQKEDRPAEPNAGAIAVKWAAEPKPVAVGDVVMLPVQVSSSLPVRGMPVDLVFDPSKLELVDAIEGEYFKQNGAVTSYTKTGDASTGRVTVAVIRNQATGATGEGSAFLFKFKALSEGVTEITLGRALPLTLGAPPPAVPLPKPIKLTVH